MKDICSLGVWLRAIDKSVIIITSENFHNSGSFLKNNKGIETDLSRRKCLFLEHPTSQEGNSAKLIDVQLIT